MSPKIYIIPFVFIGRGVHDFLLFIFFLSAVCYRAPKISPIPPSLHPVPSHAYTRATICPEDTSCLAFFIMWRHRILFNGTKVKRTNLIWKYNQLKYVSKMTLLFTICTTLNEHFSRKTNLCLSATSVEATSYQRCQVRAWKAQIRLHACVGWSAFTDRGSFSSETARLKGVFSTWTEPGTKKKFNSHISNPRELIISNRNQWNYNTWTIQEVS